MMFSKYIIFNKTTDRFIGGVKYKVFDETPTDYIIKVKKDSKGNITEMIEISKQNEFKTYTTGDIVSK